ncbi:MAG: peptidase domain-containing ABC transporter [Planctomycetaceae bacterium]
MESVLQDSTLAEVDAAASLLEQLDTECDLLAERSQVSQACRDATSAWPGSPHELWWRWVLEAGESLGFVGRALDCKFAQLVEVGREGGRLIIRVDATGEWLGVSKIHGSKVRLLRPATGENRGWSTVGELKSSLQFGSPDQVIRCVVIDPERPGDLSSSDHAQHMTPLARAWALLRPEAGDMWIIFLFALVAGVLAMATPLAIEALVSTVTFGRMLQPIVVLSLMLMAFLAFQAAIKGLQTYVVEIIQRRLFARVAADLAYRMPRADFETLHGQPARELLNRFFDVVTVQKITAQLLLDGISIMLSTLIGMTVLGFYHPWLLGFDAVLIALIAFSIFVLGRGAIVSSIKESKCKYHMAAWLEDLAGSPIAFRFDGGAQFAFERANRLTFQYLTERRRHFRILMRQIVFALGLQAIASTVLLGLGGWLVIDGQLTLGQLVAAEVIVTIIVGSFAKLGKHMEGFYDLMASVDKLGHLFDIPMERHSGLLSLSQPGPASLEVSDLQYTARSTGEALPSLSFSIPAGSTAVMLGSDERAHSLLFDILYGLRTPQRGYVLISGVDPRELRPDILRRAVSLVRDIEIFEGTVAQNIHLERPDISPSAVREALKDVGLLEEVLALPRGLDTPLNMTGTPFSRSQQFKLMIVRAIVGRPSLLLIDAALDGLPDGDVQSLMSMLCQEDRPWTMLVATGRRAVAEFCAVTIKLPERHRMSHSNGETARGNHDH